MKKNGRLKHVYFHTVQHLSVQSTRHGSPYRDGSDILNMVRPGSGCGQFLLGMTNT